jgi:hypothetical protein
MGSRLCVLTATTSTSAPGESGNCDFDRAARRLTGLAFAAEVPGEYPAMNPGGVHLTPLPRIARRKSLHHGKRRPTATSPHRQGLIPRKNEPVTGDIVTGSQGGLKQNLQGERRVAPGSSPRRPIAQARGHAHRPRDAVGAVAGSARVGRSTDSSSCENSHQQPPKTCTPSRIGPRRSECGTLRERSALGLATWGLRQGRIAIAGTFGLGRQLRGSSSHEREEDGLS